MRVYHDLNNFDIESTVITVGTFDGVHFGHRQILNSLISKAREINATPVVFTFSPHPKTFFQKLENPVLLLNSITEKVNIFKEIGIENVVVYAFDKDFSQTTFPVFITDFLIERMNMKALIIGHDNHFGKNRTGNFETIKELSEKFNFEVFKVPELKDELQKINSTTIKELLLKGDLKLANKLLAYNYKLSGKVIEGLKIGSKIGFPTANIELHEKNKLVPANGVYAVKIKIENSFFDGILNIGNNPTFIEKLNAKTIEVHIFNFNENIYNQEIELELIDYLRPEIKFKNKDELIAQIENDIRIVKNKFRE